MTTSNSPSEKTYDVIPPDGKIPGQLFVDGFEGILLGPALSKVGFHQVINVDSDSGKKQRRVVLTLAMPTHTLIEFCQRFLKHVQQNETELKESLAGQIETIDSLVAAAKK